MVVVTGMPRTGTSLVMQTLEILGVPIAGEKFPEKPKEFDEIFTPEQLADILEGGKKANPKGFYELRETVEGVTDPTEFKGKAIKIILPAIFHSKIADAKIIWCIRDPRNAMESRKNLARLENGAIFLKRPLLNIYDFMNALLNKKNYIIIDFDEMVSDPITNIQKIADLVGCGSDKIEAASKNVEPSLRRSKKMDLGEGDGELYVGAYELIRKNKLKEALEFLRPIKPLSDKMRLRNEGISRNW